MSTSRQKKHTKTKKERDPMASIFCIRWWANLWHRKWCFPLNPWTWQQRCSKGQPLALAQTQCKPALEEDGRHRVRLWIRLTVSCCSAGNEGMKSGDSRIEETTRWMVHKGHSLIPRLSHQQVVLSRNRIARGLRYDHGFAWLRTSQVVRSWCPFCTEANTTLQSHGVVDLKARTLDNILQMRSCMKTNQRNTTIFWGVPLFCLNQSAFFQAYSVGSIHSE